MTAFGGLGLSSLGATTRFAIELALLLGASLLLFGTVLAGRRQDIHRMVLAGIIFGVMFRSLASFLQRFIDPNDFVVVQGRSFARFGTIESGLLTRATALCGRAILGAWLLRHRLDVIALG